MFLHSSLSVVQDILAVRTDVSCRNSRIHRLPKVMALQARWYWTFKRIPLKSPIENQININFFIEINKLIQNDSHFIN